MIHADLLVAHPVLVPLLASGALLALATVLTFAYRRLGE
jgi:hypothetical protein